MRVQTRYLKQNDALQNCSLLDIEDYRRRATLFESIGAYRDYEDRIIANGSSQVVVMSWVNDSTLNLLGVQPIMGRLLTPDEDRPGGDVHKALISYELWQSRFGSDSTIVGSALRTDWTTYTIVGVMPPLFAFPERSAFWASIGSLHAALPPERAIRKRSARFYPTIGRLKPGVTLAQAESDLNRVAEVLEREFPNDNDGVRIKLTSLRVFETGNLTFYLRLLMVGVAFVVSICCANVAGLLLMRGVGQRRDLAIRAALGAGRGRIIRALLVDAMLLALAGGVLGLVFAYGGVSAAVAMLPAQMPFWMSFQIDRSVLAFSLILTIGTGIVFGMAPAVQTYDVGVNDLLKDRMPGSPAVRRLRAALVVAEVALAVTLLVSAALLMQTLIKLQQVDTGFDANGLVTARINTYQTGSHIQSVARLSEMHRRLLNALASLPGVTDSAVTNGLPFATRQTERRRRSTPLAIRGRADMTMIASVAGAEISTTIFASCTFRCGKAGRSTTWTRIRHSPWRSSTSAAPRCCGRMATRSDRRFCSAHNPRRIRTAGLWESSRMSGSSPWTEKTASSCTIQ